MSLFSGDARYPDLDAAYDLYLKRSAKTPVSRVLDKAQFNRIVKLFCKSKADELEKTGMIDLPCGLGMIAAVKVERKPTFDTRTGKYRTSSRVDWDETRRTGKISFMDSADTFGFVFVPKWKKGNENLRCVGIRANKELYRRMKDKYDNGTLDFFLPDAENFIV